MSRAVPFIGIDFGTSKSAMAWYNPESGQAEILRNAMGEEETPSVIYLADDPQEILVGTLARRKLEEDTQAERHRFVFSVKRNLLSAPNKVLGKKVYTPVDVAAIILRKLKEDAEKLHFYEAVKHVVITYPASFGMLEQDKIRQAALGAGFNQVELLAEPMAAATAYAREGLQIGEHVLVYDFGGGTFDVALLSRGTDGSFMPILPPEGVRNCGGDDIDRELYSYCEEIAQQKLRRPINLNPQLDWAFLLACRARKENLSFMSEVTFSTYLTGGGMPVLFQHTLNRVTFEAKIRKYVEKTVALTQKVLEEAEAQQITVDTPVLIGGSSRIPLVSRLLDGALPVKPRNWQKSDFAVALGAAYHAYQVWGEEGARKAEVSPRALQEREKTMPALEKAPSTEVEQVSIPTGRNVLAASSSTPPSSQQKMQQVQQQQLSVSKSSSSSGGKNGWKTLMFIGGVVAVISLFSGNSTIFWIALVVAGIAFLIARS